MLLPRPDDLHVHLRDGDDLGFFATRTATQFARAVVMPNLDPPVVTADQAVAYRARILASLEPSLAASFEPLMTLYLTDGTPPDEVDRAVDSGVVVGFKLYPQNATTNSARGVSQLESVIPVLARLEEAGLPLLVHGEVTGAGVDVFDREREFLTVLATILTRFPRLRIVLEHVTTEEAVRFVAGEYRQEIGGRPRLGATITAHHLLIDRNALFQGGLRPHNYCLPVAKRSHHRLALLQAAVSGIPCFFAGTDSAPHAANRKESACGCAGCFTAPHALELYATAFEQAGALERLGDFLSAHGADFYGLRRNEGTVVLERFPTKIPDAYASPSSGTSYVPFWAGTELSWSFVRP